MCPEQQVYLDHRQHPSRTSRCRSASYGPWRTSTASSRHHGSSWPTRPAGHVLGSQADVWTEVMDSQQRLDYPVPGRHPAHGRPLHPLDALGYRPPGGPLPWRKRPGVLGRPIDGAPPNV
ncbi:family 20 glycosylhydrolase [Streptomyces tubercidicus]|uniref:family 20 glycosylhydrolase n=1 Tax=Streptomyces tubercidicus TaxID=47759 RepID=UPI003466DF52